MSYQIIKPEVIRASTMNDKAMTRQFVEMYLVQCPLDFEDLEVNIVQRDRIGIENASHHIKPTMAYIGADSLRLDFQELENLARKQRDFTLISDKFISIKTRFHQLLSELKVFLEEI